MVLVPNWAAAAGAFAALLTLAACGKESQHAESRAPQAAAAAFLASHWAQPRIATSGEHASLAPASCGECHAAQLEDWRGSLHRRAMGPGVAGQLASMSTEERADCQRCHTPLAEQSDPRSTLHAEGLVCAGCHMRNDRVYGPARRDGSALESTAGMPHGGWTASGAFEDSRFCASCHQFEADGYALNGKLLENTYEEWRASRHAREGRTCQSCHMPERRHLWRGIHDPDMARSALTVQAQPLSVSRGEIAAAWQIVNTGAGHFFPTYVTPRIVIWIRQESADGAPLKGTEQRYLIERRLTPDLRAELSDSRLAPDEKRVIRYAAKRHARATHVALEMRVEPDAFYTALYRSLLNDGATTAGREQIARALRDSLASHYTLYSERRRISPTPRDAKPRSGAMRDGRGRTRRHRGKGARASSRSTADASARHPGRRRSGSPPSCRAARGRRSG